jgi:hypothetical protein
MIARMLIALLALACALGCGEHDDGNVDAGAMMNAGAGGMMSAGTGAAGGGGMPAFVPGSATFSAIYAEIIVAKGCTGSPLCHAGPGGGLTLSQQAFAYTALVDVPAKGVTLTPPHCRDSGLKRVVPGAPEQSLLLLKVEGSPPCGQAMPPNPPLLDAADIQRIRDWIMAGAPND